jgi:hypothetical protein
MTLNWDQKDLKGAGVCAYTLEISTTRKKMFFENIDEELPLAG